MPGPWVQAGVRMPLLPPLPQQGGGVTGSAGKGHPTAHLLAGEQGCAKPRWHGDTYSTGWYDAVHLVPLGFWLHQGEGMLPSP